MTGHRIKNNVAFSCDDCPETYESDTDVLRDAWAEAQSAGWTSYQYKGSWFHRCEDCSSKQGAA
jgi:hypothetical protein